MSRMIKESQINYDSKILDIGSGSGLFLQELREIGFNDLDGLELFIEKEIDENGVKIYISYIEDFNPDKTYDLIFFKDSLEHMENPLEDLKKVREWLNEEGYIIITIPVKTEYFYNLYGVNWFQLDAPCHFITFSLEGFKRMISNLKLDIEEIIFNSDHYSVIISEDYLKGNDMYSKDFFLQKIFLKIRLEKDLKKLMWKN